MCSIHLGLYTPLKNSWAMSEHQHCQHKLKIVLFERNIKFFYFKFQSNQKDAFLCLQIMPKVEWNYFMWILYNKLMWSSYLVVVGYWKQLYIPFFYQKADWKLHRVECQTLSKLEKERLKYLTPSIRLMVKLYLKRKLQEQKVDFLQTFLFLWI